MKYLRLFENDINWEDFDEEEYSNDKETIYSKDFTNFLIDNNIYDKFINNVTNIGMMGGAGDYSTADINRYLIHRLRHNRNSRNIINYAFIWSSTPEYQLHSSYWTRYNDIWNDIINDKYIDID